MFNPFASKEQSAETVRPAFPGKMLVFTSIVVVGFGLAFYFLSVLDDLFGIGLDLVMVASMAAFALLVLSWAIWFLAFSRMKIWKRIASAACVIAVPMVFFTIFQPVIGGDANIVGFRPFWVTPEKPSEEVAETAVDLTPESALDFPRFLGPQQNSTYSLNRTIDHEALSEDAVVWKQPIGLGWSGFVARNGFAVTMEQRDEWECVTCYSIESGELQWIYRHKARHRDAINMGGIGPRSTPVIHNGNVYAIGAIGNLVCLDGSNGEVIWQVDLNEVLDLKLATLEDRYGFEVQMEEGSGLAWGRSGSPLVVEDTLVVPGGGRLSGTKTTLLAFDLVTGEQRWAGGEEMIAYGSPVLATVAGVPQILLTTENAAAGYHPENGRLLWKHSRPGNTGGEANTSQLTVVSDNQILTTKGYRDGGGELIELSNVDGVLTPESVWKRPLLMKTKLMSPVIHEGHSYALSNAFLECTRLSDGKRLWKRRGRFGHGQLLMVDGLLVLHSELGTLYLIDATPESCEELAQIRTIEGVCWNTLCLYGDRLLVRSNLEAACVRLPTR